jgi:tRNA dimethylallyltransferase
VVAIFGPTGVGKTAVAVALADRLRARGEDPVAISADALQVYLGLEQLTGAPTAEERARLEHRLVGFVPVDRTFSVGEFGPLAHAEIDEALARGRRPIVVGGTGLYLRAALTELDLRPPPRPGVRERLEAAAAERGLPALYAELERRAPAVAARTAPRDRTRVIRALELLEAGEPGPEADAGSQLWSEEVRRPTLLVGLIRDRPELYRRIERRVDEMVARGAGIEVERALAAGASTTARQAVGFKELARGDVEGMKAASRRLAKRQLTWMRKLPNVQRLELGVGREAAEAAEEIARRLEGATTEPV